MLSVTYHGRSLERHDRAVVDLMSELVSFVRDGEIGIITVNNPPVNALSPGVPEGIIELIDKAEADEAVRAVVLIGAGRTFIAGADIREFGKITAGEKERGEGLHPLTRKLEGCSKPLVAAIHGTALGGGLEVSMACHYRVAVRAARVGQPEVKLGLIPGAGGTQRLPRLAGVAKAAEMCALGDPITAEEALASGILDRVFEGNRQTELLDRALEFAAEIVEEGAVASKTRDRDDKLGTEQTNAPVLAAARDVALKKRRGVMAALKAIDSVEAATRLPFDEGIKREVELFKECLFSDQSKALIHAFFGERAVRKTPDIPPDTPVKEIRKAAVVGAGTMGGGITMAFVNAGIPVRLREVSQEALDRGLATIRENYERSIKRGRFTRDFVAKRVRMIEPTLSYAGFAEADIVVEAVFEDLALKKQIFSELDGIANRDAILATNTSALDIDDIASVTSRPEQVIGTHFFSPANLMRLLEIVRGKATSAEVIASCTALAKRLRKVGVVVGNCHGFVGNRMFGPYMREAQFLVEEGARPADVDQALYEFGMAMGPPATSDLAGIDVGWRVRQEAKHLQPEDARRPLVEDRLYELGRYGQKAGLGWYRYDENRNRTEDPSVSEIIADLVSQAGIEQREISGDEIVERTIYALVNEGARIIEEGYALRAVDIDMIYINGYGFPAYRGGPMWYADTIGLEKIYERVLHYEDHHGYWWRPAPLLKQLAEQGKTFAGWDAERGAGSRG